MKYFTQTTIVLLIAVVFVSCEKQEYFKSESTIRKELAYSWKQVLMSRDTTAFNTYMMWTFKDDKLSIVIKRTADNTPVDTLNGSYSVRTTMTKVYVTTSSFPNDAAWYWLNAEWNVVYLDSKGLVIASEDPSAGGINEREFTRID